MADPNKFEGFANFLHNQALDVLQLVSPQAYLMDVLLGLMLDKLAQMQHEREQQRLAQGGPRVLLHVSQAAQEDTTDQQELTVFWQRSSAETDARYALIHSFGAPSASVVASSAGVPVCLAENVFRQRTGGSFAKIADVNNVFYELGYWLGSESQFARSSLDAGGSGQFTFRDLVAWWTQSSRGFLFLFDDAAFKLRHE